ncbi:MAG TPA: 2'-5' RNA ligase family protein [Hanamia sp.]|nr:2'-5' RNA ligase family protein [Hanamia sp.]
MNNSLLRTDIYMCPHHEYLLVLKPNANVAEKILQVKEDFSVKFKVPSAKHSYPHITLVNFLQFRMRENRLLHRLNTIAMGYHPFTVSLKDYGSFPSHTIYLNIESKQQVQNLIKELAPARQLMTLNKEKKPHFMDDPHLTVARKLLPWQYEQGWNEYSHKYFTAHFIAESMLLLRRPLTVSSDRKIIPGKYQKVMQFQFLNLPVTIKQGELFS